MANLGDFIKIGEQLKGIFIALIQKWSKNEEINDEDRIKEREVITKLKELLATASEPTHASLGDRAESIVKARAALNEILIQVAQQRVSLPQERIRVIRAELINLQSAFGLLLEIEVFKPIERLLPMAQIQQISQALDGARQEIENRREAKQALDTMIDIGIIVAKLAANLAILL
jgi:hypothetical protein